MPAILLGTVLLVLGYAAAFLPKLAAAGPWLLLVGMAIMFPALGVLGARGAGKRPLSFILALGVLALVLLLGFGSALLLPEKNGAALWLGLPRRAALVVYGIGLLPAVLLPLLYAASFGGVVLSEEELKQFRARLAALRENDGAE